MGTKFNIDKVKIEAILDQQKCKDALKGCIDSEKHYSSSKK
jgi:hypothetical protein